MDQYIIFIGPRMALYTPAQLTKGLFATLEFSDGSIWLQAEVCPMSEIEFVCIL